VPDPNAGFACGSVVLYLSFFTKLWLSEPQFCEKDWESSALPEAISTSG
jgi:hypothetical protein